MKRYLNEKMKSLQDVDLQYDIQRNMFIITTTNNLKIINLPNCAWT